MITSNTIYWITRLDALNVAMLFIFIAGVVASISWAICFVASYSESGSDESMLECKNFFMKKLIFIPVTTLTILLISIFIPTTKEACAMYVIPKIANNENLQNLSKEAYDLAHAWIEELKPKHEDKNVDQTN